MSWRATAIGTDRFTRFLRIRSETIFGRRYAQSRTPQASESWVIGRRAGPLGKIACGRWRFWRKKASRTIRVSTRFITTYTTFRDLMDANGLRNMTEKTLTGTHAGA